MKVVIIDDMHPEIISLLEERGLEVDYRPDIPKERVSGVLTDCEGLIVRSKVYVDEHLLASARNLKFVARAGAGTDNLDEEFLKNKGIAVFNAPEGNRDAVGDHTVGLILALLNNFKKSDREIADFIYDREGNRGLEMSEVTIGLVGLGNTGSAVAKRCVAFGARVLAYDKYISDPALQGVDFCDMSKIFTEADVVSFHVPLTYETNGMINEEYIMNFKKNIFLINTSRGKTASNRDLWKLYENGKIRGMGLDVIENEKMSTYTDAEKEDLKRMVEAPQIIITPHVAGWTFSSYRKISSVLAEKIIRYFDIH